jgi:hypothetical protein
MTYIVEDQKEPERVRGVTLWRVTVVGSVVFLVGAEKPEEAIHKARQWLAEQGATFDDVTAVEHATGIHTILI